MYKGSPRTVEGTKWSRDVKGSISNFGMLRQRQEFVGTMMVQWIIVVIHSFASKFVSSCFLLLALGLLLWWPESLYSSKLELRKSVCCFGCFQICWFFDILWYALNIQLSIKLKRDTYRIPGMPTCGFHVSVWVRRKRFLDEWANNDDFAWDTGCSTGHLRR